MPTLVVTAILLIVLSAAFIVERIVSQVFAGACAVVIVASALTMILQVRG